MAPVTFLEIGKPPAMSKRRNVFISHHHVDDQKVTDLTNMLKRQSYEIRNSSIRVNADNRERLRKREVSDDVIKRLLRMKMAWASTVVVIIGKDTAKRPWVNWEIEMANRLGKRIVGVYERGGSEHDVPEALVKYGSDRVAWNTDSIIEAIEGRSDRSEDAEGRPLPNLPGKRGCAA